MARKNSVSKPIKPRQVRNTTETPKRTRRGSKLIASGYNSKRSGATGSGG